MAEGTNEGPKFQQARKVSSEESAEKRMQRRWAGIKPVLGAGIIVAGAAGTAVGFEYYSKIAETMVHPDNPNNKPTHELKLDTSKYRFQWEKDGIRLNIREQPRIPTLGERNNGKDNIINPDIIEGINNVPWNGKSELVLDNSLIVEGVNPASGIGSDNWFAVNVDLKGTDEDLWAYINNGSATSSHIQKIEQGEIAEVELRRDGQEFRGTTSDGQHVPHMEIGKVDVAPSQHQAE